MSSKQKLIFCGHGISPNKETESRKENATTPAHWGAAACEGYWAQCSCSTAQSEGKDTSIGSKVNLWFTEDISRNA